MSPKYRREVLRAARAAVEPFGCVVELGINGGKHPRIEITIPGVGRRWIVFPGSPDCSDHVRDHVRQNALRLLRTEGIAA